MSLRRIAPPAIALLMLAAGCSSPSPSPASNGSDAPVPAVPVEPSAHSNVASPRAEAPQAAEAPEPRPRLFHMPDEWLGRWDGPEGLFLVVTPGRDTNTVRLSLKDSLDSATDYEGVLVDNGIRFKRGGHAEIIRHGTGAETGFTDLRDRSDCLIVRNGEEGYCRRQGRPRLRRMSGDPAPAPATLPLTPGVYATLAHRCAAPVGEAVLIFDGRSLARHRARACRTSVIANRASLYTVDNSCIDASVDEGRMVTERFEIAVADARHFSIRSGQVRSRYKLCPMYGLPTPFSGGEAAPG